MNKKKIGHKFMIIAHHIVKKSNINTKTMGVKRD